MEQAQLLFNDYNYFRSHTYSSHKYYKKQVKQTQDRLRKLDNMARWCHGKSVDPRHWLYSLFQTRRWLAAPTFNQLCSERHYLVKYPKVETTDFFYNYIRASHKDVSDVFYQPDRDLSATAEVVKKRYLAANDSERCMDEMDRLKGYHPKSKVCAQCPAINQCHSKLQERYSFDIVDLRKGNLSLSQAATIVSVRRGS